MVLCAPISALSARHAVVMDAQTGHILYEKAAREPGLIASTTKIMTGLIVCEEMALERSISVPAEAAGIEGSSLYLRAGERVTVENLLYGMMLRSGNDAAAALALAHSGSIEAFARHMNERAQALGLMNTHFANPHGLDDEGNYSTCEDLGRLACAAMENETFRKVVGTKEYRFGERVLTNHNKLLWRLPGAQGVKTGFTKAAGRILVSAAEREGRRLVCVTMADPDDWNDHCALLEDGFSRFESRLLCRKGEIFGAGIASGCAAEDVRALLLPGESIERISVKLDGKGSGQIEFFLEGRVLASCPIIPIGEKNGRTDSEDHSIPGDHVPQGSGGNDPRRPRAAEREYRADR